jgi:hypothetical protein
LVQKLLSPVLENGKSVVQELEIKILFSIRYLSIKNDLKFERIVFPANDLTQVCGPLNKELTEVENSL